MQKSANYSAYVIPDHVQLNTKQFASVRSRSP